MKHADAIKRALGISGVITRTQPWRKRGSTGEKGAQIDLLIDRNDGCVNLCEMKFSPIPFAISAGVREALENKKKCFIENSGVRKTVFVTMVTAMGCKKNAHYEQIIDSEVTAEHLFLSAPKSAP